MPAAVALLQFYALPLLTAGLAVNTPRDRIPAVRTLAQGVVFRAADGVRLSGWLVPGRVHAGIVLAHGSHGSRLATLPHLRLLARAGYAVLAFDARGHGASAGRPNALGWAGAADVDMNADPRMYPTSGYVVVVLANMDPPAAQRVAEYVDPRLPARPRPQGDRHHVVEGEGARAP